MILIAEVKDRNKLFYFYSGYTVEPPIPLLSGLAENGGIRKTAIKGVTKKSPIWDLKIGGGIRGGGAFYRVYTLLYLSST